jgi:hypothetical protein
VVIEPETGTASIGHRTIENTMHFDTRSMDTFVTTSPAVVDASRQTAAVGRCKYRRLLRRAKDGLSLWGEPGRSFPETTAVAQGNLAVSSAFTIRRRPLNLAMRYLLPVQMGLRSGSIPGGDAPQGLTGVDPRQCRNRMPGISL